MKYMAQPGSLRRPLRGGWKTMKPNSQEKSDQAGLDSSQQASSIPGAVQSQTMRSD